MHPPLSDCPSLSSAACCSSRALSAAPDCECRPPSSWCPSPWVVSPTGSPLTQHNTTHTVSLLQQHILFSSYIIILRIHCMIMCNVWIFMHVIITWIKWLEIFIKYTRILYKQFSKILGYICTIFNIRLRIVLHHSRQTITINTMDLSNQIWLETMLK